MLKTLLSPRSIRGNTKIVTRSLFLRTESTPNPQSMKYFANQEILPESFGTGMYFHKGEPAELARCPTAKLLLDVGSVKSVFIGRDFVTINKSGPTPWHVVNPSVFDVILSKISEGGPFVIDNPTVSDTTILDTDDEVVATIKELLATRVRPSVQEDGGDIFYVGFDPVKGIVQVRLAGSCVGCPSSAVTLRNGVENMLMHYIPEVKGIEEMGQIGAEEDGKLLFKTDVADAGPAST